MKFLSSLLCLACLFTVAHAAQPEKASIEKLLAATEVEKLLGSMIQQLDGVMKSTMDQAAAGSGATEDVRQFAATFQKKMMANLKEEMSWENMKDLYIQIYSETFTQEEIDGLIAFYQSPVGKAFVVKMPVVMQKSMTLMQRRMGPMMEKMQRTMAQAVEEVQAMKKKNLVSPAEAADAQSVLKKP